ncbi:hypothetical protein DV495_001417 [Geotrichum candidum]|uniref:Protein-serine/threonine kinase n=1 Tax=Geotrichum candidum TaxID=1173061 RepID=A0A0J9X995_GEOCN|nr:hypothetical protein DV452_002409 [Geotrichum candidum]KAI9214163.1 hypothetical protein DS838_000915 [Geotrichum bryndzae]KAF5119090.1 hypothetical protein DV454_000192 [Geotrichum candidum]KAF5132320.1 hypothetical protein DV495_001417 [Geotrichum candidum]KAF7497923.1 hypothetical protein DV113_004035 [Geotrichum candidum]
MSRPWKLTEDLTRQIYHYAHFPSTGISLNQMVQFGARPSAGTLFRASQFVAQELPIRLAHRVKDLEELPYGLSNSPSIIKVRDWYAQSFEELTSLQLPTLTPELKKKLFHTQPTAPIVLGNHHKTNGNNHYNNRNYRAEIGAKDVAIQPEPARITHPLNKMQSQDKSTHYYTSVDADTLWPSEIYNFNKKMTETLKIIKRRHDPLVTTVAQGVVEWKQHNKHQLIIDQKIQSFLDRFYMSRIGIRMLIGQHIALNTEPVREDYVGIICTNSNVREIAQDAVDNARFICEQHYDLFEAPKVDIVCNPNISFMYVPGHLSHMLFEIIKNSLRAVVETHGLGSDVVYPPVKIIVAEGNEDITIKISDEGGGIPRSAMGKVWTYMYTTVEDVPSLEPDFNKTDFKAPMAGFGYGLPISRLYARYFGGDLKLISMEGYGTDAYLHLNRLSTSSEPLQ